MRKRILFYLLLISLAVFLSFSINAEEPEIIESWTLVSGNYGDMTAVIYENDDGGHTLDISVVMKNNRPVNMPYNVYNNWSGYRESITKVIVGEGVYNIGDRAFSDLMNLRTVELSEGIINIGNFAFANCSSLSQIVIPSSVTNMNACVFSNCSSLQSVESLGSIKNISTSVFEGCSSLTYVNIPESVVDIGSHAFGGCTSLTEVSIPSTVKNIGTGAFRRCSKLNSIVIPDSVTVINIDVFTDCASLTSVTLGSSVSKIDTRAFCGCTNLKEITLPNTLVQINSYAFQDCRSLSHINIPASVTSMAAYVFAGCSSLTIKLDLSEVPETWDSRWNPNNRPVEFGGVHLHKYTSFVTKAPLHTIPGELTYSCECGESYTEEIAALTEHQYTSKVTLEPTHTELGVTTYSCACGDSYTEDIPLVAHTYSGAVTLAPTHYETGIITYTCVCGASYTENIPVEEHYFVDGVCSCGALESDYPIEEWVLLSNISGYIKAYLFKDHINGGYKLEIAASSNNETLLSMPAGAYSRWSAYKSQITSVTVTGDLYNVSNGAFNGFSALVSAELNDSLLVLDNSAFSSCSSLTSVYLGNSLTKIGQQAFYRCSALTSITLPETLTSLGAAAFSNCSSLDGVVLPSSVTVVPSELFLSCSSLRSVTLGDSVTVIDKGAFNGCRMLSTITLPSRLTQIGGYAFQNCSALTSVVVPSEVTSIGDYAFRACTSLASIEIPAAAIYVGRQAFVNCGKLTVNFEGDNIPASWQTDWNYNNRPVVFGDVHIHAYVNIVDKEATHTEIGVLRHQCSCGDSYNTEISIIPHSYVKTVIKEATHTEDGLDSFTCSCGDSYTKETAAIGHTFSFGYCYCGASTNASPVETWDASFGSSSVTARLYVNTEKEGYYYLVISGSGEMDYWLNGGAPWWDYKDNITDVKIEYGVTCIGAGAFMECSALTNVLIASSVKEVKSNAFIECTSLKSLVFPEGVQKLNDTIFTRCTSLESVVFPSTLTEIGILVFADCTALKSVIVPASVEKVGYSSFSSSECPSVTVYAGATSAPSGWSSIPSRVVWGSSLAHAHSFTSEILNSAIHGVKQEVKYTCSGCGYSYVGISSSLTYHNYTSKVLQAATHYDDGIIEYSCDCGYSYTQYIEKIEHTYIDGVCDCGAVRGTDPVEIWNISASSRDNVAAFLYHDLETDNLFKLVISGTGRMKGYSFPWLEYRDYITEVVIEDGVRELPPRAFERFTELKHVKLGNGIEIIRNGAFRECVSLVSVEATESLKRLESGAFNRCIMLESVTGIKYLDFIGSSAFERCESLKEFNAEYVREIQVRAFNQCTALVSVNIIGGIEVIRDRAFENCKALVSVKSLDKLLFFGREVFLNCYEIDTLVLNENCYNFTYSSFANMRGLKTIIILGDIKEIPDNAFANCTNLKTVYINTSAPIRIGRNAFNQCTLLENVIINGGIYEIGDTAFRQCRNLKSIYLSSSVPVIIGNSAFENCVALRTVVAECGIESIGNSAFGGCSVLESITLSDKTLSIGTNAFYNCRSLKKIFISNNISYIGQRAFYGCNALTIYAENIGTLEVFADCNPQRRPIVTDFIKEELFANQICYHENDRLIDWIEIEPTHFSIGLKIISCSCGAYFGEILPMLIDHEYGEWASDGSATHSRRCFCGYVDTVKHGFVSGICYDCGLQKNVLIYDDIESIEASNGMDNLEILFDGLNLTTGLNQSSSIEYYPSKDRDYILITLKDEVDLGGIIFWICGDKTKAKVTVFNANNEKTGEGKIEFNGGDYTSGRSLPVNITFFGTASAKTIKIETEPLHKESGVSEKISEIELILGTKLDVDSGKPHTNIELIFDIPTLNAIGIELTPEILEKLNNLDTHVESDIGKIILDAISMGKVSSTAGNVTIGINDITTDKESKTGKKVFSITVNDENGNPILPPESSEDNGTLTLSFKYHKGLKKEQIKVVYRDENGKIQHMEVESYDPVTGEVTFKTNHLSDYEIYADGISNDGLLEGAFDFKGYSVNEKTGAICFGFTINYEIIEEYEAIMEMPVDFGVVFASYERLNGSNPLDENGNVVMLDKGKVISYDLSQYAYSNYDFVLKDITESLFDHSFVVSGFASALDGVYYYQENGMTDTISGISYNEILSNIAE